VPLRNSYMKTKALILLTGVVVAAVGFAIFYQWHRYREAERYLAIVQRMTPGKTQIDEVMQVLGKAFSGNASCPSGTCTFTRSFDSNSLERLFFRKHVTFVVEVSVEGGLVTHTWTALKIIRPDYSWVGALVLRSQHTPCGKPESSCTSINVADDRRTPIRVISELPGEPLPDVKQRAYDFDLNCLLMFSHCATIDDIYPEWKKLSDLPPVLAEARREKHSKFTWIRYVCQFTQFESPRHSPSNSAEKWLVKCAVG